MTVCQTLSVYTNIHHNRRKVKSLNRKFFQTERSHVAEGRSPSNLAYRCYMADVKTPLLKLGLDRLSEMLQCGQPGAGVCQTVPLCG